MSERILFALFLFVTSAHAAGTYAVWYSNAPQVLNLPYIHGGQIVVQWSELQTGVAAYDWSALDSAMSAAKGQRHRSSEWRNQAIVPVQAGPIHAELGQHTN